MAHPIRVTLEDRLNTLFQPDILAEDEYAKTLQRKQHFKPEEQLMLAVLEDAVFCFQKYVFAQDKKGQGQFREAEEWILENNSEWFFSFKNICEVLEINPEYFRRGLLRWKEKQLANKQKNKKKRPVLRNHTVPYR
jgi:hypothetical protein